MKDIEKIIEEMIKERKKREREWGKGEWILRKKKKKWNEVKRNERLRKEGMELNNNDIDGWGKRME